MQILSSCTTLNAQGNYVANTRQLAELHAWERKVEALDAQGIPRPAPPVGLLQRPLLAASVPLPPVSFPHPVEKTS